MSNQMQKKLKILKTLFSFLDIRVSKTQKSDSLRRFKACADTHDQNSLQKLNQLVASMDVYLHAKNQLYTSNNFRGTKF